jgi:uncharacterized membrane protein (DUF4010 family)
MIDQIFPFAVALFIGLLVGIERERSKGEGPDRREAGLRTFALASLLGAVCMQLGGTVLLSVALGAIGVLLGVAYYNRRGEDPGVTTEVGLLLVVLLGAFATSEPTLAAGLGVALAIILAAKAPIHSFARNMLTASELKDAFLLAFATLIVWPLLPDRPVGPYGAINPYKLWSLVILVMVIGAAGHIAVRALGGRYGLPLSGFASGFVSSAATVGAMGQRAKHNPSQMRAAVAGAALSTIATFLQMAVLLVVASPITAATMAPALAAGGLVAAAYGLWFMWQAVTGSDGASAQQKSAFSLIAALILAATLGLMLVGAAFLNEFLGQSGVLVGAALAGFADAHAPALSIAGLVAGERLTAAQAVLPILAAMSCNAVTKIVLAFGAGSRAYALRIAPGLVLSIVAAWVVAFAVG